MKKILLTIFLFLNIGIGIHSNKLFFNVGTTMFAQGGNNGGITTNPIIAMWQGTGSNALTIYTLYANGSLLTMPKSDFKASGVNSANSGYSYIDPPEGAATGDESGGNGDNVSADLDKQLADAVAAADAAYGDAAAAGEGFGDESGDDPAFSESDFGGSDDSSGLDNQTTAGTSSSGNGEIDPSMLANVQASIDNTLSTGDINFGVTKVDATEGNGYYAPNLSNREYSDDQFELGEPDNFFDDYVSTLKITLPNYETGDLKLYYTGNIGVLTDFDGLGDKAYYQEDTDGNWYYIGAQAPDGTWNNAETWGGDTGTKSYTAATPDDPVTNEPAPAGTTSVTNPNGSTTYTYPDASTVNVDPKTGISIETDPDGTKVVNTPNGISTATSPDGTKAVTNPKGVTVVTNPDGTTLVTTPKGVTALVSPDGTKVIIMPNGTSTVVTPDGNKTVTTPDGTITTTKPDGTIITTGPTVTRTTDQSGDIITLANYPNGSSSTVTQVSQTPSTSCPPIKVKIASVAPTSSIASNGFIYVYAENGSGSYSFSINDGKTSRDFSSTSYMFSHLSNGITYTVSAKDNVNVTCPTATATIIFGGTAPVSPPSPVVGPPDVPTVSITPAPSTFDLNAVIIDLRKVPKKNGYCARAVGRSIEKGGPGYAYPYIAEAKDWGSYLKTHGWKVLPVSGLSNYTPVKGDVVVFDGFAKYDGCIKKDGHPEGHIEMFDGTNWYSFWKQMGASQLGGGVGFWPGGDYCNPAHNFVDTYTIYRR